MKPILLGTPACGRSLDVYDQWIATAVPSIGVFVFNRKDAGPPELVPWPGHSPESAGRFTHSGR
jgi:hypothetical protein